LDLPFLKKTADGDSNINPSAFPAIFIRAPIVERLLPNIPGIQAAEAKDDNTVVAPSRTIDRSIAKVIQLGDVEVMAVLPGRTASVTNNEMKEKNRLRSR